MLVTSIEGLQRGCQEQVSSCEALRGPERFCLIPRQVQFCRPCWLKLKPMPETLTPVIPKPYLEAQGTYSPNYNPPSPLSPPSRLYVDLELG